MKIVPLTLKEANTLVSKWHRHHKPCVGHRFSIGLIDDEGNFHGAAICGRPVARALPQFTNLEVSRLVTDGTKNACSMLYASCARIAKEMGFVKIQTYILDSETGVSLKASGWIKEGNTSGGDWSKSRPNRRTDQPMGPKQRWSKKLW